jgi:hypothetical protein
MAKPANCLYGDLRLFQNFKFGNSLYSIEEKPGFDRFFQELVPKTNRVLEPVPSCGSLFWGTLNG